MDAGGGLRVHLVTSDFASHAGWAAEYAAHSRHRVSVARVAGARWKWRMLAGTPQLASPPPCDVLVVDGGMMDCSAAVAELRRLRKSSCPAVVLYMHENQLTTPFAANDRDVRRGTSWHFGAAHIRSLQCADAVLFNSATHLEQFAVALPRLINEQSPRDTVAWHLAEAQRLIASKCRVLHYGLSLHSLAASVGDAAPEAAGPPTVLWNARLEDDKCPGRFYDALLRLRQRGVPFRLIVLGTDPSAGQRWHARFRVSSVRQRPGGRGSRLAGPGHLCGGAALLRLVRGPRRVCQLAGCQCRAPPPRPRGQRPRLMPCGAGCRRARLHGGARDVRHRGGGECVLRGAPAAPAPALVPRAARPRLVSAPLLRQ